MIEIDRQRERGGYEREEKKKRLRKIGIRWWSLILQFQIDNSPLYILCGASDVPTLQISCICL